LRYIIKGYNKFLKSTRDNISIFFDKKKRAHDSEVSDKKVNSELEELNAEISLQERNLREKDDIEQKHDIRDRLLYLYIKKRAIKYNNGYIKIALNILDQEVEDSAYEALDYLNRVSKNISPKKLKEIHIIKGLLYEMLEDFDEAAKEYKEAIKYDKTTDALKEYKSFVERSREVLNWHKAKNVSLVYSSLNLHNIIDVKKIPDVAKRLDSLAKYYARSPKSREVGKRYFKEVIKLYKKLYDYDKSRYSCEYINALIDGVEYFMMSATLLQEAYRLLVNEQSCIESRIYLLERIRDLKQKGFIKQSGLFD